MYGCQHFQEDSGNQIRKGRWDI